MQEPKVNVDPVFLGDRKIIETVFSPVFDDTAILILGENYKRFSREIIISFYLLKKEESEFCVNKELQSFAISNYKEASRFIKRLPQMSALELIIAMGIDNVSIKDKVR